MGRTWDWALGSTVPGYTRESVSLCVAVVGDSREFTGLRCLRNRFHAAPVRKTPSQSPAQSNGRDRRQGDGGRRKSPAQRPREKQRPASPPGLTEIPEIRVH